MWTPIVRNRIRRATSEPPSTLQCACNTVPACVHCQLRYRHRFAGQLCGELGCICGCGPDVMGCGTRDALQLDWHRCCILRSCRPEASGISLSSSLSISAHRRRTGRVLGYVVRPACVPRRVARGSSAHSVCARATRAVLRTCWPSHSAAVPSFALPLYACCKRFRAAELRYMAAPLLAAQTFGAWTYAPRTTSVAQVVSSSRVQRRMAELRVEPVESARNGCACGMLQTRTDRALAQPVPPETVPKTPLRAALLCHMHRRCRCCWALCQASLPPIGTVLPVVWCGNVRGFFGATFCCVLISFLRRVSSCA